MRVCTERSLPPYLALRAAELAIRENPENQPVYSLDFLREVPLWTSVVGAGLTKKRWRSGRNLRISFMNGDADLRRRVAQAACLWTKYARLRFDFGSFSNAEIRIQFNDEDVSDSFVGTDNLLIPEEAPTMRFGWLTPDSTDAEIEQVVLHEFGHALALIHEHQSPSARIQWNREAVYDYYARQYGWSEQLVEREILEKYARNQTQFTEFDSSSIMVYAIPDYLTLDGYAIDWNCELSDVDKKFVGRFYGP